MVTPRTRVQIPAAVSSIIERLTMIRALPIVLGFVCSGLLVAAQAPNPAAEACAPFTHAMDLTVKADHAAALAEWTQLAAAHPNTACIENRLGLELLHAGEPANAIPHFENAIALDPKDAEPHNSLGAALLADAMHAQHDRAEREFKRAIELDPKYADAQMNLGNLYRDEGDAARAEQLFRAAMASDPRFIKAYVSLARTLAEQSRLPEADAVLTRALALDADNREALRLRKQIRMMMRP